jgi:hypothetical protein
LTSGKRGRAVVIECLYRDEVLDEDMLMDRLMTVLKAKVRLKLDK